MSKYWHGLSDRKKAIGAVPISIMIVILLGVLDFKTGYELSFFIFYVFPVAIAAWFVGLRFGLFISLLSALVWYYADLVSGREYSAEWIAIWNGSVRFVFFTIDTFLLSSLKKRLDFEKEWARIDGLTGALNGRGFRDKLETMFPFVARTKAPFAMAFIDLDNFKKVNDTQGHAMGDLILQRSVATMQKSLRETDFIGRMGGDEFAIFLPATDAKGVEKVLHNMRQKLLDQVAVEGWGIGYSIGVVTHIPKGTTIPPYTDVIQRADKIMYTVKKGEKNNIVIEEFS